MFKNKTINCVIPARMSSSRFHGKPLAKIHGREMILRVAEIASLSAYVDRVIVATEDPIIQRTCEIHGYESMLTDKHYTCTHRVAEVADRIKSDYVFNLQGDEPLTRVSWIDDIISHGVANDYDMVQALPDPSIMRVNLWIYLHKMLRHGQFLKLFGRLTPL